MALPVIVTAVALYICFSQLGVLGNFWGLVAAHMILITPYIVLLMSLAIAAFDERTTHDTEGMKLAQRIRDAERELDRATAERSALGRDLGRVEGALDAAKRRGRTIQQANDVRIPREDLQALQDLALEHSQLDDHASPAARICLRSPISS